MYQGMSVSKLRNKEESAFAAKKVQKKVELQKPLTMAEALKEKLARRNAYVKFRLFQRIICFDCFVFLLVLCLYYRTCVKSC